MNVFKNVQYLTNVALNALTAHVWCNSDSCLHHRKCAMSFSNFYDWNVVILNTDVKLIHVWLNIYTSINMFEKIQFNKEPSGWVQNSNSENVSCQISVQTNWMITYEIFCAWIRDVYIFDVIKDRKNRIWKRLLQYWTGSHLLIKNAPQTRGVIVYASCVSMEMKTPQQNRNIRFMDINCD